MDHRLDLPGVGLEEFEGAVGVDDVGEAALRDVAPLVAGAEAVDDDDSYNFV